MRCLVHTKADIHQAVLPIIHPPRCLKKNVISKSVPRNPFAWICKLRAQFAKPREPIANPRKKFANLLTVFIPTDLHMTISFLLPQID